MVFAQEPQQIMLTIMKKSAAAYASGWYMSSPEKLLRGNSLLHYSWQHAIRKRSSFVRFDGKHTRDFALQKLFFDWTDSDAVSGRLIPRKSSQQFGKKLHGMQHGTARGTLQLLDAGDAAGNQRVRAHGALGGLPLLHKLFGYSLADIVEIFFVPEASGHPAAFHLRTGDFKAEPPQEFDRG